MTPIMLGQIDASGATVIPPGSTFALLTWAFTYLAIYFGWGILSTSATNSARKYVGRSTAVRWSSAAVGLLVVVAVPALAARLVIPSAVLLAVIPVLQASLSFYRRKSGGIVRSVFYGIQSTVFLAYRLTIKTATGIGSAGWFGLKAIMNLDWHRLKEVPDRFRAAYYKLRPPEEGKEEPREVILLQESGLPLDIDTDARMKTFPRSVPQRLTLILKDAIALRAAEVQIAVEANVASISFRIDGEIVDGPPVSFEEAQLVIRAVKMLTAMDTGRVKYAQEGVFPIMVAEIPSEVFVATAPSADREKMLMRIAVDEREITKQGVDSLGFDDASLEKVKELLSYQEGLILITGRPDAGRSTTIYAAIEECSNNARTVATVEKAAQHRLTQIPQTITAGGSPEAFAEAMQIALIEDPEVIVVRDIADAKTADLCMKTALAGRLVVAGFAANDAATAVERLLQLGANRALLDVVLSAVVSQRLARILCDECKKSYQPSEDVLRSLGIKRRTSVPFYRETGCLKCRNTGYKGRTGVFEILVVDDAARSIMTKDSIGSSDRRKLLRNSMLRTLQRSGVAKVVHGVTSITEIKKVLR